MQQSELNIALRPLSGSMSFQYGTWDVEAKDWWHLVMLGAYDGTTYTYFRGVDGFINFILQKRYSYWRWFAHYGGRYDLNFLFDHIRQHRPDLKVSFYCAGSSVVQMTIRKRNRSKNCVAKLCDSYRLLPRSLRDLCQAFSTKTQKGVVDFENIRFSPALVDYNEADVVALHQVLASFFESTGIRSETFASHALRLFRKEFLKIDAIWKPNPRVSHLARLSYKGGRVEVFKRKAPRCQVYDVNSMYPFVMLSPVPITYIAESTNLSEAYFGFVKATVYWPDVYAPSLPTTFDKLYFPVGEFTGVWTTVELFNAMEQGLQVQKVHKAYYFGTDCIFDGYVKALYKLKKSSDMAQRTIAKFLLNSHYGKFGQNPTKKVYVTEQDGPKGSYPILKPDGKPSGFSYYERTSNAAYLLPHIAAAITSRARVHLSEKINEQSLYCDTDSIFTTETLETGDGIGEWGYVGRGEAEFYQAKLYKFMGKWKAKGLNLEQDIDSYVEGGVNIGQRHRSIKEAMRTGLPACGTVDIEKRIGSGRAKRKWDGTNDTRPWNYKELVDG